MKTKKLPNCPVCNTPMLQNNRPPKSWVSCPDFACVAHRLLLPIRVVRALAPKGKVVAEGYTRPCYLYWRGCYAATVTREASDQCWRIKSRKKLSECKKAKCDGNCRRVEIREVKP
jgi:hypothetical protein